MLAVLMVLFLAWGSRDVEKGWKSVEWTALLFLLILLLAGGFLGRQAGRWYGGYQYREAQRREGIIGNLALIASNQEEKLRTKEGETGAIWGVILAMGIFGYQGRFWDWMKRLFSPGTNARGTPPC